MSTLVGVLGGHRVSVDERGTVRPEDALWELAWWIGADDRWHFPGDEPTLRQSLVDAMPVVRTAIRVPGGDAVQHVFGAAPGATAVEVANESPAPFVAALVVRGAGAVATDGHRVVVDGRDVVAGPRAPARWAAATDGTTRTAVVSGAAHAGEMPTLRDRAARLEVAFLYPVAHRTSVRLAVTRPPGAATGAGSTVRDPSPTEAARGWRAQLRRGMRVDLPDAGLQAAADAARAQLLLLAGAPRPDPEVVAALEDWGFDAEVAAAWPRLGRRARRVAARRSAESGSWRVVRAAGSVGPARFLRALRDVLVVDGEITQLLADWPPEWQGLPLDVRDAPTRRGPVSYSVRWHDARVAVLWDAPGVAAVRVPAFDADWCSEAGRGEVLLDPAPSRR